MTVERDDLGRVASLEPFEAPVDALPARRDQIDEEREVVETGVSLRDQLLLQSLESTDRVVEETLDLGQVPCHGEHLAAEPLLNRLADAIGQRGFEREGRGAERLDLLAGAAQRGLEPALLVATLAGRCDPLLCSFQCLFIHERKATLAVG